MKYKVIAPVCNETGKTIMEGVVEINSPIDMERYKHCLVPIEDTPKQTKKDKE